MPDIEPPSIKDDGIHLFPLSKVRYRQCESYASARGQLTWSPFEGARFSFEFPDVLPSDQDAFYHPPESLGGAGVVGNFPEEPDWTAQTSDGSEVGIVVINEDKRSEVRWGTDGGGSSFTVEGTVAYAFVNMPKECELSFWHDTPPENRAFMLGFDVCHWPEVESVSFQHNGGTTERGRGSLTLVEDPRLRLVGAGREHFGQRSAWLCPVGELDAGGDTRWVSEVADDARRLLAFLAGRRVPFLWKDEFVDDDALRRTYYGWHALPRGPSSHLQPVPLGVTCEALTHSHEVTPQLPGVFARMRAIREKYDIDWVISPVHQARFSYVDDKLAPASVSLERLRQAHQDATGSGKDPKLQPEEKGVMDSVRRAVKGVLEQSSGASAELRANIERNIGGLCRSSNAGKLVQVFADLGIELSGKEVKVIQMRNKALHGSRTLTGSGKGRDVGGELERFETLVTLIHKAILVLLGYEGPYVDYSDRRPGENYPVKYLQPANGR